MQFKVIISKYRLGFLVERERPKKPRKGKTRTEKELRKRLKWLIELRKKIEDYVERDIEIPFPLIEGSSKKPSKAEAREQLGFLNRVIAEYAWLLKEED